MLAAPLDVLRSIAARINARRIALPSLDCAVVAFTGANQYPLTERDRDYFWRTLQVPLFEQRLSLSGTTLASECCAHQGLHILAGAPAAGFSEHIEHTTCPCGVPGPRLISTAEAMPAAAGG